MVKTIKTPIYRPKVKLAHPPGHIFWKTEPVVDKLSLFIERVVEEYHSREQDKEDEDETPRGSQADEIEEVQKAQGIEAQDDVTHEGNPTQNTSRRGSKTSGQSQRSQAQRPQKRESSEEQSQKNFDKVRRIIERIYSGVFTEDLVFMGMFDMPPKDITTENGIYFKQVSEKEFECRLFLKRFTDQNACQLIFGAQSDIPPGMAVYKLNDQYTSEQKYFTKQSLGPCMDEDGYMSPGKIYPWFAVGIMNCIQKIIDEENDDRGSNSCDGSGDFDNLAVVGEFPVMKIIIPTETEDQADSSSNKSGSVEKISLPASETNSTVGTPRQDKKSPPASSPKEQNRAKSSTKPAGTANPAHKPQWYPRGSAPQQEPTPRKGSARGAVSSPLVTPRSNTASKQSSRTFSSYSSHVETVTEEIEEEPIIITIKPAIKGYGLPKSIKLQHALPKQKPYCEKGIQGLKGIHDNIEDGQSMWYLEASPVKLTANVEKSARFRSTFRKIGRATNFWNINFGPINEAIQNNMKDVYDKHEFSIDLAQVKSCIQVMKAHHMWSCISDEYIDVALMNVVKSSMLTMRSVGECTVKVLRFLQGVVSSRSCPSFLQPNVNIAGGMSEEEAQWVGEEMRQVVADIEENPSAMLLYIGYSKKQGDETSSRK